MIVNIQLYTTPADVRGILGVAEEELPDRVVLLDTYGYLLEQDLRDVRETLPEEYQVALENSDAASKKLVRTTRTFASLALARALCMSLPMFGPKDISDSKATISRFADSPYKETSKRVEAAFGLMRQTLQTLANGTVSNSTFTFMAVASPSYDPVVGS